MINANQPAPTEAEYIELRDLLWAARAKTKIWMHICLFRGSHIEINLTRFPRDVLSMLKGAPRAAGRFTLRRNGTWSTFDLGSFEQTKAFILTLGDVK